MVTADMVKPGAAVVDVGVSRDDAGKLVGDVASRTSGMSRATYRRTRVASVR